MSTILSAARAYARLGLAVFPVGPDCRTPWCKNGHRDASFNPDALPGLIGDAPNLALACGPISGVFVVDVDCKGADGFESLAVLEDENGWLPESWKAKTPSGGQHLFFRQPDRIFRNRVGFRPGLDIRTAGGSVALAPSKRDGARYTWARRPTDWPLADAPPWLLDVIDPPAPPRAPPAPIRVTEADRMARYVAAAVDAECDRVAHTPANTGRNVRLFQASANLAELVAAGLLPHDMAESALEGAAHDCGLIRDDGLHAVRATIASGFRKGLANPREVAA